MKKNEENILPGIGVSPGICIGKAYIVDNDVEVMPRYSIPENEASKEINRFKAAVKHAETDLKKMMKRVSGDLMQSSNIIETHIAVLKDKSFYDRTVATISEELVNAEWAIKKVTTDLKARFKDMEDPYLKQRREDIEQISGRVKNRLTGNVWVDIASIDKRVILVAKELTPAETSQIRLERVKGFVTASGGKTSHTGIVARSLAIPAVLGAKKASETIRHDEIIIVDGNEGIVIQGPSEETLADYEEKQIGYESSKAAVLRNSKKRAVTRDGVDIKVLGNIELPEEVFSVIEHGASGIGLFRTEFHYMRRRTLPDEEELFEVYKDVAEVVAPEPVVIRTLDINGDKTLSPDYSEVEPNPAMGLRAIRYSLGRPDLFLTQLKAILRAAAFGNVKILFPMISSLEEIKRVKELMDAAATTLEKEGREHHRGIEVGIMIEVPSSAAIADIFAEEADFFSIGTNDLIQYSLAMDRSNSRVDYLYEPLHPAILRMIKNTCDAAAEKNIRVAMCGEMAGDPFYLPVLLGLGVEEFSMNPQAVPAVKNMIRSVSLKEAGEFVLNEVLGKKSGSEIRRLLEAKYKDMSWAVIKKDMS